MSDEQWGPWIEHDGRGCPAPGHYGQVVKSSDGHGVFASSREEEVTIEGIFLSSTPSWDWGNFLQRGRDGGRVPKIIRYRVKKPKGLTILENLIAEIPEEVAG